MAAKMNYIALTNNASFSKYMWLRVYRVFKSFTFLCLDFLLRLRKPVNNVGVPVVVRVTQF
jgi:hypothetical protein